MTAGIPSIFPLTVPAPVRYHKNVTAKSVTGFDSSKHQWWTHHLFFTVVFLYPQFGIAPFLGGPSREPQGSPVSIGARSVNLLGSALFAFDNVGRESSILTKGARP